MSTIPGIEQRKSFESLLKSWKFRMPQLTKQSPIVVRRSITISFIVSIVLCFLKGSLLLVFFGPQYFELLPLKSFLN